MNPANYEQYLRSHSVWFRGHNPETSQAILQAENRLGVTFPKSLKWLLTQYGYWRATGVSGLPAIVGTTLANRNHFPDHWIILGQPGPSRSHSTLDRNGSGDRRFQKESIILVLSQKHLWDGKAVFYCDSNGHIIRKYSGFTEYTAASHRSVAKHSAEEYRVCFPSFHLAHGEPLLWEEENFNLEELQRRILETILFYELCLKTKAGSNFSAVGNTDGLSEKPIQIASACSPVIAGNSQQSMTESQLPKSDLSTDLDRVHDNCIASFHGNLTEKFRRSRHSKTGSGLIAELIERRRDYLLQHQQNIPTCYQDSSSSPRQNLQWDSSKAEGHLLIVEAFSESLESATSDKNNSRGLSPDHLKELGIAPEQIVSLICNIEESQSRDWLVCWLPDSQRDQICFRLKSYSGHLKYQVVSAAEPMTLVSELKKVA